MVLNTAVFIDVENLLKGYSFSPAMAASLSLRTIVNDISKLEGVGGIAVIRAYANWSDPRLGLMRGEINEMGIEPIQVFGFGKGVIKNAADIQMAIDAIDIAHVRPGLEAFVIVSGDGGFASLAKKLHEYSKFVVGGAYPNATNKVFASVCDHFLWISDPEDESSHDFDTARESTAQNKRAARAELTDPRNVRLSRNIGQRKPSEQSIENVLEKVRAILDWYGAECPRDVTSGLVLSVTQEAIRYAVPGFQPLKLGLSKLSEFVQCACTGTRYCLVRSPQEAQPLLVLRHRIPRRAESLPDIELREVHSAECYVSVLASGAPFLRLPDPTDLHAVVRWVAASRPRRCDLYAMIEQAVEEVSNPLTTEAAKLSLLALINGKVLDRPPEGSPISAQVFSLPRNLQTPQDCLLVLRNAAQAKLESVLGQVKVEVLKELLPDSV